MAVPFRRVGKTRKRKRRTHFKLSLTGVTKCQSCGEIVKSHTACTKCGKYKGKQVVEM
ncbi:50S ribosomal protein L32 [Mollicutes bacterium LVI A0039]|nr:50S ribosomal protein L32 [Mollicutes bacterium LVI A0039]